MTAETDRERTDIQSMYPEELKKFMAELGEKPFLGTQVFTWLHQKLADSYGQMTNLSAGLRQKLESLAPLELPQPV